MNITATSEAKAQVILESKSVMAGTDWYSSVRLVGWISQDRVNAKTTLYTKWQRDQYNYYPYSDDSHQYSVTFGGSTLKDSFALHQSKSNGTADLSTKQKVTVSHNSSGEYTGNLSASGFKCWEDFSFSNISITFPTITVVTPDPEDEDAPDEGGDPPAEIEDDNSSFFYIYCDKKLLYAAGSQDFPLVNPKLTLEVNRAGSLVFTIPVTAEMYDEVKLLKSTIDVRMGDTVIWRGRPLKPQRNTLNNKTWTCEGFLSWLSDRQLLPYKFPENGTSGSATDLCKRYLSRYNSRATDDRKIVFKYSDFSGKVTVEQTNHSDAWTEFNNVLIQGLGAYVVPYLTKSETGIMLRSAYGSKSTQVIQFGTNLISYDDYIDGSAIFTAVRPYGKETETNGVKSRLGLTGSSFIVNEAAVERYGRIEKTVFFDEITTEAALRKAATEYLNEGIKEALSITIKAVDLHLLNVNINRIKVGDWVRVVSVPHGLDSYFLCSKIVYDLAHPKNNVYTFGATQTTISEMAEVGRNKYVITEGA